MDTTHGDVTRRNRDYWEAIAAERHGEPLAFFRTGGSALNDEELAVIGDPGDLRVLHLACAVGDESLTLAMRGATVVGIDISPTHVARGRAKAIGLGLDVDFRVGDMTDLDHDLRGFDLIFISSGGICWVPDIEAWARTVADRLSSSGRVVISEHHPLWEVLSVIGSNEVAVTGDYFSATRHGYVDPMKAPQVTRGRSAPLPEPTTFVWGIGRVVAALLSAGLQIETLQEFGDADLYPGLDRPAAIPSTYLLAARTVEWHLGAGREVTAG